MRRFAAAALTLTLVGCGTPAATDGVGFQGGDGTVTIVPADKRETAPALAGQSLAGEPLSTADHAGKVIVVNVWGSWCAPCRSEAPEPVAAKKELGDDVAFLGLNTRDHDPGPALAFERSFELNYPSIFDPEGKLLIGFGQLPPKAIPARSSSTGRQGRRPGVGGGQRPNPGRHRRRREGGPVILLESWASQALTGSMLIAIPVAILAGVVSFASPCVLPLLPGYLSYASGLGSAQIADGSGPKRLLIGGTLGFVLGFSVVFVLTGALIGGVGQALLTNARVITVVLGVLIMVLGAGFAGWIPIPSGWRPASAPKLGVWASPLLGMVFGLGWTPCIGPALSVVLTLALNEGSAVRGGVLAFAYAIGLGLPFLAFAAAFTALAPKLDWLRRHQRTLQRIGGITMILVGLAMVVGWWDLLVAELRQWAANFGTIL